MKQFSFLLGLLFIAGSSNLIAQNGWNVLGSAKVNGHSDHDVIMVTGMSGDYTAVKLLVENEGIDFTRVIVHFANGGKQDLNIRRFIPAGGETKVLDLNGNDRVISKVDFFYKSNAKTASKGKVILYGKR
jgi:hypothetical protein